jgi:hypothetical protein
MLAEEGGMAKVIDKGFVGPDDPMFKEPWTVFGLGSRKPKSKTTDKAEQGKPNEPAKPAQK